MTQTLKNLFLGLFVTAILCSCSTTGMMSSSMPQGSVSHEDMQGFPNNPAFWQGSTATIWDGLQHIPPSELRAAVSKTSDPNNSAWINLAIISKQFSTNTPELVTQIMAWRAQHPSHPANALIPDDSTLNSLKSQPAPKHIVLLLPLSGPLASSGQVVRNGFLSAYYQAPSSLKGQQNISFSDTNGAALPALYQKAIAEGADGVAGPLTKNDVQSLLQAGSFPVPTLALNYTERMFGSLPSNFYEFGLSPVDEAKQLATHVLQEGHTRAIIIAPRDAWGQRVVKPLTSQWQASGGTVVDTLYFTPKTDFTKEIAALLHVNPNMDKDKNAVAPDKQRRQDFNAIILLARPETARQIVPLLKFYYANNVPIYSTSVIYSGTPSSQDSDLNGVTFTDAPWALHKGSSAQGDTRLYAVGRDAYLILSQIDRLQKMPAFPIYGATGALTLTSSHEIYRRLPWVQMHNGHP